MPLPQQNSKKLNTFQFAFNHSQKPMSPDFSSTQKPKILKNLQNPNTHRRRRKQNTKIKENRILARLLAKYYKDHVEEENQP